MDKKKRRFYVGSHWGNKDDGYVCSSSWMKQAYSKRPESFKRRIVSVVTTTRRDLLEEEHRWLKMIKNEELGVRYYNIKNARDNQWWQDTASAKGISIREKISLNRTGVKHSEEAKRKISENHSRKPNVGMTGKRHSDETKEKMRKASAARKHTAESNEKNRQAHLGRGHTEETRLKIAASMRRFREEKKA